MPVQEFATLNELLVECPIVVTDNYNDTPITELLAWIASVVPSQLVLNVDGSYTHTPGGGGTPTNFGPFADTNTVASFSVTGGILTLDPGDGSTPTTYGPDQNDDTIASFSVTGGVLTLDPGDGSAPTTFGPFASTGYEDQGDGTYDAVAGASDTIDTNASTNPYAPAVPGDYAVAPTVVSEALDELAARDSEIEFNCVDDKLEIIHTSGKGVEVSNTFSVTKKSAFMGYSAGEFSVDGASPDQTVLWQSDVDIDLPCSTRVAIRGNWSLELSTGSGTISTSVQWSVDGGAWSGEVGGLDTHYSQAIGPREERDFVITANPIIGAGTHNVAIRIVVINTVQFPNTLVGQYIANAGGALVEWSTICCDLT